MTQYPTVRKLVTFEQFDAGAKGWVAGSLTLTAFDVVRDATSGVQSLVYSPRPGELHCLQPVQHIEVISCLSR